jgi:hypothetical protein
LAELLLLIHLRITLRLHNEVVLMKGMRVIAKQSDYGWMEYWESSSALTSGMVYPFEALPSIPMNGLVPAGEDGDADATDTKRVLESHLRSTNAITGYHVSAKDGDLGYVGYFVIDDTDWSIRYLVLDTGAWSPGRHILLATGWIESISWNASRVSVDVPKAVVETCPTYDPSQPITRDDETRLFAHCQRPGYWEARPLQTNTTSR